MTRGIGERARLTPVDVIFIAVGLAALTFLVEPMYALLDTSSLSTGTELMFRMLPPGLVAMLIFVAYRTALIGGS
jgi:Na+/melibiose symporter-like transporter